MTNFFTGSHFNAFLNHFLESSKSSSSHNTKEQSIDQGNSFDSESAYKKCLFCPYKTFRSYDLNRHMSIHDNPIVFKHHCNLCDVSFKTSNELKLHLKNHPANEDKHKSKDEESDENESDGKLNLSDVEVKNERYCCPKCPETFTIFKNLKRHQSCHSSELKNF